MGEEPECNGCQYVTMEEVDAAIMGVAMAVVLPTAIYFAVRQRRKRLYLYQRVAGKYPDSRCTDGGFWKRHELEVSTHGVRIKVWMWATKNSRGTVWESSAVINMPTFRVYREGVGSSLGKSVFGTQDISVGAHGRFDDHFMVKGDDAPLVRRAWGREVCELMLARFFKARIVSDDGGLKLTEYRLLDSERDIEGGIELVGKLASGDVYGVAALQELEGASFHRGAPPYVIVSGPANIRVGPIASAAGTVTCATCPAGTSDKPPQAERLAAIDASFSRVGNQLRISWSGIETQAERLSGAIDILRELTRGPSAGVFR